MNAHPMSGTMASSALTMILARHLHAQGIDIVALCSALGLDPDAVQTPQQLVPLVPAMRLYAEAARCLHDPLLGVTLTQGATYRDHGLSGYILAHHPTIGAGIREVASVLERLLPLIRCTFTETPTHTCLTLQSNAQLAGVELFLQSVVATFAVLTHQIAPEGWRPVQLHLVADVPDEATRSRVAHILRDQVTYGAPCHSITFHNAYLAQPVPTADAVLLHHLRDAVDTQVAQRRSAGGSPQGLIRLEGCVVDLARGEVQRGEERVHLTTRERALLAYLAERPNQMVPRAELEAEVWGIGRHVVTHAPAVAVRRLRQKIEPDPKHPVNLVTVFGEGWRLDVVGVTS